MRERVEVVAPASTANLGPGFDSIGMALNLFTTVRVELAEETRLFFHSDSLAGLPTGDDNLLLQVMQNVSPSREEARRPSTCTCGATYR